MKNMTDIINITKDMYIRFQGSGDHFLLFWVSLLGLILWNKKNNQKINLFLVIYSSILMIIFICPITAKIIMEYCVGYSVYWRMLWLLPYVGIIAYTATNIVFDMNTKVKKATAFLGIFILIAAAGTNVYSLISIDPTAGAAKIPPKVGVLCEELQQYSENHGISEIKVVMPDDCTPYIRQYDASIQMPYGRNIPKDTTCSTVKKVEY